MKKVRTKKVIDYLLKLAIEIEPVFNRYIYMSIIAMFVGLSILIIRKIFRNKISPKWMCRIWIVFIISLIIPVQVKSPFSIYNYININEDSIEYILYELKQNDGKIFEQSSEEIESEPVLKRESSEASLRLYENEIKYNIRDFMPTIWVVLISIMFLSYLLTYIFVEIKIRKGEYKNEKMYDLLNECKNKMNINKKIKLVNQEIVKMPGLFGIIRIRILINDRLLQLSDNEIQCVFLHELAHYKRKDNILNILITVLKVIYIFNPIIWILLNCIKNDLELATDELAMKNENKVIQKEYSKTLVKLSANEVDKFLIQTLCMSEGKKNLERRIDNMKMIEKFKNRKVIGIISLLIIIFIFSVFVTKSNKYITYNEILELANKSREINNIYMECKYTINNVSYANIEKTYYLNNKQMQYIEIIDNNMYDINNGEIIDGNIQDIRYFSDFDKNQLIQINRTNNKITEMGLDEKMLPKFLEHISEIESRENDVYKFEGIEELNGIKCYKIDFYNDDVYFKYWINSKNGLVQKKEIKSTYNTSKLYVVTDYKYEYEIVQKSDVEAIDAKEYGT